MSQTHNTFTKLFVDDERETPDGWDRAYSFHEAIFKLELLEYNELSLDHDLGSFYGYKEMTGMDIVHWLIWRKRTGLYVPEIILVHSANPIGGDNMRLAIERYIDNV